MNHKEMTKHIRGRIKVAGIKTSVCKMTACGSDYIRVSTASHEQRFTDEEMVAINTICKSNGLTSVRGMEIEIEKPFAQGSFYMPR